MAKYLWFDMDGTIYNLYSIPGWLDRLKKNDMTVFNEDAPRKSLPEIRKAIHELTEQGWTIGVVTWAPMEVKEEELAFKECEAMKMAWLNNNFPEIQLDNFFCLEYGQSKRELVDMMFPYAEAQVLVDDNKVVRADWRKYNNFITINASRGYIKELEGLIG